MNCFWFESSTIITLKIPSLNSHGPWYIGTKEYYDFEALLCEVKLFDLDSFLLSFFNFLDFFELTDKFETWDLLFFLNLVDLCFPLDVVTFDGKIIF